MSRRPLTPRDVLGVPALPPARATLATTRLRSALARLHRRMAPPPLQVLESLLGVLDLAALVALCDLDVPDHLDGPTSPPALAARVDADPAGLERLLRYAATRGWVRLDRRGRVRPTATTRFLRRDHPAGWRGWVDFMAGSDVGEAALHLAESVRTGGDAFLAANGASFFPWMAEHPERGRTFDAAMAAGARLHGLVLTRALDWSGDHTVCDVGGGDGTLLMTLLDHQPQLQGVLLDLPSVTDHVSPEVRERLTVVGGDAFAGVPAGATTYLLVNVIHDWGDDDAVRLLRSAAAVVGNGRVVVIEAVRRSRPLDDVALRTDLLMLAVAPGGRERSTEEVTDLAAAAGLRRERTVLLASGDAAHVLRAR
jgi:hypothetical protein